MFCGQLHGTRLKRTKEHSLMNTFYQLLSHNRMIILICKCCSLGTDLSANVLQFNF